MINYDALAKLYEENLNVSTCLLNFLFFDLILYNQRLTQRINDVIR